MSGASVLFRDRSWKFWAKEKGPEDKNINLSAEYEQEKSSIPYSKKYL